MTTEEIITLCTSGIAIVGGAIGMYIKSQIQISNMRKDISVLQTDNDKLNTRVEHLESSLREHGKEMIEKMDGIRQDFHEGFNDLKDLIIKTITNNKN
jgi:hypothetical protein